MILDVVNIPLCIPLLFTLTTALSPNNELPVEISPSENAMPILDNPSKFRLVTLNCTKYFVFGLKLYFAMLSVVDKVNPLFSHVPTVKVLPFLATLLFYLLHTFSNSVVMVTDCIPWKYGISQFSIPS